MAANRVGRRQGRGAPGALSPGREGSRSPGGLSPGREGSRAPGGLSPVRGSPGRSPGVQRRAARVTVKYNRQELQRRLDTERWIDGRLGELYRGRVTGMHRERDRGNGDGEWEPGTDRERDRGNGDGGRGTGTGTDTERWMDGRLGELYRGREFIAQLLALLKGLPKQRLLQRPPPKNEEPP
ncbi:LOW QUALITY PROTEIN: protein phosphatase 1 regulatory subunit 14A-like [Passerculus sandwichensis]